MFLRYPRQSKNLTPLILDEYLDEGKIKTIRYRIVSPKDINSIILSLPLVTFESIEKMNDKNHLKELENKYDDFLEKYCQILLLNDIVEEYLDIRDALAIKVARLERQERIKLLRESEHLRSVSKDTKVIPKALKLSNKQIKQGYIPYPNEPKEYKCGCFSLKYYSKCICKKSSQICNNNSCNERLKPILKFHHYCLAHNKLKNKKDLLENELNKINKELLDIKLPSNLKK